MNKMLRHPLLTALFLAFVPIIAFSQPAEDALWKTYMEVGSKAMKQHRYATAEIMFVAARNEAEEFGKHDPRRAQSLCKLGDVYDAEDDNGQAMSNYRQALDIWRKKSSDLTDLEAAECYINIAKFHETQKVNDFWETKRNYVEANRLYERAITIRQTRAGIQGQDDPGLVINLKKMADTNLRQGESKAAEQRYKDAIEAWRDSQELENGALATTLYSLALMYFAQTNYKAAARKFERAIDVWEKLQGPDSSILAYPLIYLGDSYHGRKQFPSAEPYYNRAIKILEETHGKYYLEVAYVWTSLANNYSSQGKNWKAESMLKSALEIERKQRRPPYPEIAITLNKLAAVYFRQGQYEIAEKKLDRSVEILRKTSDPRYLSSRAEVLMNYKYLYEHTGRDGALRYVYEAAEVYFELGEYGAAEKNLKEILTIFQDLANSASNNGAADIGEQDVQNAIYQLSTHLGLITLAQGKYRSSESYLARALAMLDKMPQSQHLTPDRATVLNNLAKAYYKHHRYDEAEPLYREAIELAGRNGPGYGRLLCNYALLRYATGENAQDEFEEGLAMLEHSEGRNSLVVAAALDGLAELFVDQGKYRKAKPLYRRVLLIRNQAIREQLLLPTHPDVAKAFNRYIDVLRKLGKETQAENLEIVRNIMIR